MKKIALLILLLSFVRGGGTALADDLPYTLSTPAGLNVTRAGWNATDGITASSNQWIKLTVTASSDWKLTSEHGDTISYYFAANEGGERITSWDFSAAELHTTGGTHKDFGAVFSAADLTRARPGNYSANLKFVVSYHSVLVDLSLLTENYTARDGDILINKAGKNIGVFIPDGATVTLWDANITSIANNESNKYAGITCSGDVTLILSGDNAVKGGYEDYPGILIVSDDEHPNSTLTIKGNGKLTASSNRLGAGIGGGYLIACGNIVIESGDITATGGEIAAGIGSGFKASCGTITISGGTVTANGGNNAAGIGSGYYNAKCEGITITTGVTSVTATKGGSAPNSIGAGNSDSTCGNVTIEDASKVTQN